MVKNNIKVYARLKKDKKRKALVYDVIPLKDSDMITIYQDGYRGNAYKFKFDKVFDTSSTQSDIFENIARPVIDGTLSGYNGTVFAYGPTGTGKTYSVTGSHTKYHKRGLIPRAIEYIFRILSQQQVVRYKLFISYLEIYNENAYDLLNPKPHASSLEELPRVHLLEDQKGEAHFKNLSIRHVASEVEAMQLLFQGDTNRTIAETPMNEYSSRSHCIFTIYLSKVLKDSMKIRKSKLNLVDLAGSERVNKSHMNSVTLNEAKYINLSLHYLEQVILALSESKRAHVPFRNSIMTFILRDSISGNCMTAMLSTISTISANYEETLNTCKFAQRVSLLNTNATINDIYDPDQELVLLRNEVTTLRKQIHSTAVQHHEEALTDLEENECKHCLQTFINSTDDISCDDPRKLKYCLRVLKDHVINKENAIVNKLYSEMERFKMVINQKDEEIATLTAIHKRAIEEDRIKKISMYDGMEDMNFECVEPNMKCRLDINLQNLKTKIHLAKSLSQKLTETQNRIVCIRKDLDSNCTNFEGFERLSFRLRLEQKDYRETLSKLHSVKNEIDFLKYETTRAKNNIIGDFQPQSGCYVGQYGKSFKNVHGCRLSAIGETDKQTIPYEQVLKDDLKITVQDTCYNINTKEINISPRTNYQLTDFLDGRYTTSNSEAERSSKLSLGLIPSVLDLPPQQSHQTSPPSSTKETEQPSSFGDFMKNVPLTGDADVDDEIIKFYKLKFIR